MRLFRLPRSPENLAENVLVRLAESFTYLSTAAESDALRGNLTLAASRLGEHRVVPPQVGWLYLRIVASVESGDEAAAVAHSDRLLEALSRPWSLEVARYGREELGEFYKGFADVLFDESYGSQPIGEPAETIWREAEANFDRARVLIRDFDPEIHREIEALWSRIYLGIGNCDAGGSRFGGATSMVLWGGTFANAAHYNSEIKAAEFLVHEVTHALLFAIGCDDPLVLNAPDEVFDSPLRKDPRPMDGIFHATLVCARVAEFYEILRTVDTGLAVDGDTLGQCRDSNVMKFLRGYGTVAEFGRLSPEGADLLEQAHVRVRALRHGE